MRELRATARPGKAEILIKVFGEAAGAFAADDLEPAIRLGEQSKHMALRAGSVRGVLGLAYYRAGRWKEAGRELSAFRRIHRDRGTEPGSRGLLPGDEEAGARGLELCDEIDPARVSEEVVFEGAIVAAGALTDMNRLDEAIERFESLDLRPGVAEPHHLRAWYVLGDLLERKARFTQAASGSRPWVLPDADLTDAPERARRLRARN